MDRLYINKLLENTSKIGGYIIFPSERFNGKATINAQRGINPKIKDMFDLTLECIRLY